MAKSKDPALKPGDRVKVRFGHRYVQGVVTSIRDGQVHVQLNIDGADEPVAGLYNAKQLATV